MQEPMYKSDEWILERVRDEERREEGFAALVEKYGERLYWHIRRMVRRHEDADDILQDSFVKAFERIDRFRGESSLYTWLFRIATNEALRWLERRKHQASVDWDGVVEQIEARLKADSYFDGEEAHRLLHAAIAQLPPRQQAVFVMRYFDGLKYEEIAQILEISVGALKASFYHAKTKIETFVQQKLQL